MHFPKQADCKQFIVKDNFKLGKKSKNKTVHLVLWGRDLKGNSLCKLSHSLLTEIFTFHFPRIFFCPQSSVIHCKSDHRDNHFWQLPMKINSQHHQARKDMSKFLKGEPVFWSHLTAVSHVQTPGGRRWRVVRGATRRCATGSARMASFHLHPATGNDSAEVGREAQVPVRCTRHQSRHLRGSDLPEGVQHGSHAIPTRCRQGPQSKQWHISRPYWPFVQSWLRGRIYVSMLGRKLAVRDLSPFSKQCLSHWLR